MFSLDGLGDRIRNNTVGIAMTAFVTASSLGSVAHAQENTSQPAGHSYAINTPVPNPTQSAENVTISPNQDIAFVQPQPQIELNTNPLNIQDSHWAAMRIVADAIKNDPNHQVIYRSVILDDKGDDDPSNDEVDRQVHTGIVQFGFRQDHEYWDMAKRVAPPTLNPNGITPNITTLDDYVQRLAIQQGKTGVYVGVIGDRRRVIEVAEFVQRTIKFHHEFFEESAPFVGGVFRVRPTEGELLSLSEEQKENGLILYVRGTRYGDLNNTLVGENGFDFDKMLSERTVGTGIYVDDGSFIRAMEHVWNQGFAHLSNAEYAAHIEQGLQKLKQSPDVQNFGSTDGGAGSIDTGTTTDDGSAGSTGSGEGDSSSAGDQQHTKATDPVAALDHLL